jgi:anthranilate phosphoribosyltransferase
MLEPMTRVLLRLGVKSGMVVFGQDGLDEISLSSATSICEFRDGEFKTYTIEPEQFGFTRCGREDLAGGTPEENARITQAILSGEKGPKRNAVLLNSAAAIHIARPEISIAEGVELAAGIIDSGKAENQLKEFIRLSNAEQAELTETEPAA